MNTPVNQKYNFFAYALIWLLAVGVGGYFRLYPLIYNASSDASEKATLLVLTKLRAAITLSIEKNYPELPGVQKNFIIQRQLNEVIRKERKKVTDSIEKLSVQISKSQIVPVSVPYLPEADPYYYYELTRNIERTGHMTETRAGSKYLNKLMLAPLGHLEPFTFHPYVGYFIYRTMKLFNPSVDLMYAVGFTPLLVTALTLIAFLVICAIFRFHWMVTLVSALFFLMAPIFIRRSIYGWYDNDPYNTFFPLIILTSLFIGLRRLGRPKEILKWALTCAGLITLYAFFWQGWVYLLSVLFLSGAAILGYSHFILKNLNETKSLFLFFGIILLSTFIGIGTGFGFSEFFTLFKEGAKALENFTNPQLSLWPSIFISVGELRKATMKDILDLTGGGFYFGVAALGVLVYIWRMFKEPQRHDPLRCIVLVVFFVSSFIITLGAQRFALLCLIPMSLLFPVGLQAMFDQIKLPLLEKRLKGHWFIFTKRWVPVVLTGLLAVIPVTTGLTQIRSLLTPIFNSTWEKALLKIKNETPPESIVNSWWPPGHFITAIAERRVTFDGATLNVPQAYWMANVLLASDEKTSLGLLRMLNNSANQAAEFLQSSGLPLSQAVMFLKTVTKMNRQDAKQYLSPYLKEDQIQTLLKFTHAPAPPSYIFLYNDLIENNLTLSFVNRWDFSLIEALNKNPNALKKIPKRHSKDYIQFLWNVAGGPWLYSENLSQLLNKDNTLVFQEGITVSLKDLSCRILGGKFGEGIPKFLFYLNGDEFAMKDFSDGNLNLSVLLQKVAPDRYNSLVMDNRLARSVLMRLYYFQGKGLRYFKPFVEENDLTGRTRICVYRVDWELFEKDLESTSGRHPASPGDP